MATSRGRAGVDAYFASTPDKLRTVLRGAGRAGGKVIAEAAKDLTTSEEVREDVRVQTRADGERIIVTIDVKPGWGRSVGTWLEYGTEPHFISVDDEVRSGRTLRRINMMAKDEGSHSLVIGGKFVGTTVFHPGSRPHPWLRPALDRNEREAIAEAQRYISARVGPAGVNATGVEGDEA